MTPQELKSSILQLAIQGKLVEQRPEEGTGEELYRQIQAEKKRLIQEGKIKKEKPLPEIAEDEVPFEIPEGWKWVYFGELYSLSNGTASRGTEGGIERPVLRLADLSGNTINTENVRKISLTEREFLSHKVQKDDLLFVRVNGSKERVATAFHYTAEKTISYCDHLFCGHKCSSLVDVDYVMFAFNCWATRKQLIPEIKTTAGQNTINQTSMARILLPLPPLAEQKRIVAKIEELLPYLDRYEKAWNRLEEFNRRFPADMQKSILQMAIQGKLVEQRPEEGTGEELYRQIQAEKKRLIQEGKIKKEKPLPEIAEDEVPFEIPEGWKWVYFGELYSLSNGTASRGTEGGIERPVLRLADLSGNTINTENVRKISLTEREFLSHKVQKDDLLFVRVNGSKERVATAFHYTAEKTISYCDHLFCGHKCSSLVDVDYVMFAFNCWATRKQLIPEIKTTAGQNTINQTSMARILLPLPPLAEQKRIVARLEEILPLCERLK